MLTTLVTLLGAVVGAAITAVATYRAQKDSDRRSFRHEHEATLRNERREAYITFMAACDRLHDGDLPDEARAEFRKTFAGVYLVSSSMSLRESALKLGNFLLVHEPQVDADTTSRRSVDASYGSTLQEFMDIAQRDIGIVPVDAADGHDQ
jgi:hypothetical protein